MQYQANTPEDYINQVPIERQPILRKLRSVITKNLPKGFEEGIQYGMIGYFVPHALYPKGYHCKPTEPLPFMSFASQKNAINVYHLGVYAKKELLEWFTNEFPKHTKSKLDMGKSCVRFKNIDDIPYGLIGELASKITVDEWISIYEQAIKK